MMKDPDSPSDGSPWNILVYGDLGLVRSFGEAGYTVYVGTSSHYRPPAAYSRYCRRDIQLTLPAEPAFVDDLLRFGPTLPGRTYIATDSDPAVLQISRRRDELAPIFGFLLPDHEIVEAVVDKLKFSGLARRHGLPVPASWTVRDLAELGQLHSTITYPCVVKPAQREDWLTGQFRTALGFYTKALTLSTREEFESVYRKIQPFSPNLVVQELIPGDDCHLYDLHALLDERSNVVSYVLGRKIRTYPIHYGIGCYTETIHDPAIAKVGLDALQSIGFRGLANMNMKMHEKTGELKILEINPRSSIWCYIDGRAGANLSVMAYKLVCGEKQVGGRGYEKGVKWLLFKRDLEAFFQYRRSGEWSILRWLASFRGNIVFEVFSAKDPLPSLASAVQFFLRMTSKALGFRPPLFQWNPVRRLNQK